MSITRILKRLVRRRPIDEFTDEKIRREFSSKHDIVVGLYSYGCFDRTRVDPCTSIGRYCSFARTAHVFNRNHGMEYLSTTPFLYNSSLGMLDRDTIEYLPCEILDDVWVGHNASILPSAQFIGRGSVIAAGAIVTRDVPAYAIVAGSPARVVSQRFDEATIARLEALEWWTWDLQELMRQAKENPTLVYSPGRQGV